jgi:ABC-2 type transport system permease protein
VPAGLILVIQELLAVAIMGPAAGETVSLAGLTPGLLLAFLGYFVLGFAFYAVIYAAAGSLVSRQEDLQVVALPMSLLSMAGYLIAIVSISGGFDILARIASFVPFWSPFVMLARVMVSRVEPWELALSLAILAASVVAASVVAVRVYRAGILLYGQRPGLRLFLAAARRGD